MERNAVTSYEDQTEQSQKRWTIASTSAGFALENMDVLFISFALTSIIADLHISAGQAGLISSITNLGMLFGGVVFGLIGDRYGRVKTFSYTIFIFAVATAAMFFTKNLTQIYVARFLAGIGAGGEYGVGISLIAERFPKKEIGRMTSVAAIGGQIGAILAAVIAAIILPMYGWRALFLVGLVPVILIIFVRRHVQETPAFEHAKNTQMSIKPLFKDFATSRQTVSLMLMTIVQIAGYFGLMNWLPSIMQKQLNISVSGSSVWMIATIVGMIIGMQTFGTILDKLGPRMAFGIFLTGSALSVFIITLAFNMATMLLAGAILGFFSNGMFGGYGAVISRLYPTAVRSTANNVIVNVGRAIGGFSSLAIGLLMESFNLTVVMGFLSGLYILSLLVMLSLPALKQLKVQATKAE